jgi:hypothetical protein
MRVLDRNQIEILLPIRSFFFERRGAKACFYPARLISFIDPRPCISYKYSSPAMEPFPSVPSAIDWSKADSRPAFTRALIKYRIAKNTAATPRFQILLILF